MCIKNGTPSIDEVPFKAQVMDLYHIMEGH